MAVKRWNGTAWEVYAGADLAPVKVTDGRVGKTTFIGATSPTGQVDGDIWIDQDTTTNAVVPTALTTKGDIFAATGNAAYTRFAAGNNGESLYADSTTSTGLRWQGDFNTGKNKILNGDFSIWQRGITGVNGFLADRWYLNAGNPTSFSQTRQAFTPGSAPVAGYEGKYFWRNTITTVGPSTEWYLNTYIEDVQTLAGQTATFSFWAKADSARAMTGYFLQRFGDSGSANTTTTIGTASLTTSWQRFTFTISIPSLSGKTIGANNLVQIFFAMTPASGMVIDIWGVQLEAGSVATPFTTNTGNQQAELAACQRYFQTILNSSEAVNNFENFGIGLVWATNRVLYNRIIPVTMRVAPSISLSAVGDIAIENSTVGAVTATNYDWFDQSPRNFSGSFYCAGTPFTIGQGARLRANGTANARIYLAAEL
jgi:hypothetical protein